MDNNQFIRVMYETHKLGTTLRSQNKADMERLLLAVGLLMFNQFATMILMFIMYLQLRPQ